MLNTRVEFMTPEKATEDLKFPGLANRKLSMLMVNKIANDILRDGYQLNGEPLIYNCTGGIIDGIHRLHACVQADKGFWTLIVRGVETNAIPTIDTGRSRSLPDVLKMNNYDSPRVLAGAARIVQGYVAGDSAWMNRGNNKESLSVLLQFVKTTPNLQDCLETGMEVGKVFKKAFQAAKATALLYLFRSVNEVAANEFFAALKAGENLSKDSPIYLLRERLNTEAKRRGVPDEREMIAIIVKTWNAVRSNEAMKNVKFRKNERFPKIL